MDDEEHIEEEITSVEIMLSQLKYLLGIEEEEFSDILERKLDEQIREIKWIRKKGVTSILVKLGLAEISMVNLPVKCNGVAVPK